MKSIDAFFDDFFESPRLLDGMFVRQPSADISYVDNGVSILAITVDARRLDEGAKL